MKLFNKLIPIASLASAAAVVVPLATSCGTNTSSAGITINVADILENGVYTRKTDVLGADAVVNKADGMKTYLKAIDENGYILADDLFDFAVSRLSHLPFYMPVGREEPDRPDPVNPGYKPVVTDTTLKITIDEIKADVEDSRISFAVSADGLLPFVLSDITGPTPVPYPERFAIEGDFKVKIKNLPVAMQYNPVSRTVDGKKFYEWNVYAAFFDKAITDDDKWSISASGWLASSLGSTGGNINLDGTINSKTDAAILEYINLAVKNIDIPAMYLHNVKAAD